MTEAQRNSQELDSNSTSTSFAMAQAEIGEWVSQFKEPYWPALATVSKMTEELGEVAKVLNNAYAPGQTGQVLDKEALTLEIGDILVLLTCLANAQEISLEEAWTKVMKKNKTRDLSRWK